MFQINQIPERDTGNHYLEITEKSTGTYAKICLNLGASLQVLVLKGIPVIKDLSPLTYDQTFASAVLFPFASRIKNGQYDFNGQTYQLELNIPDDPNALHGHVYNKTFVVKEQETTDDHVMVRLGFSEDQGIKGFPFLYSLELVYTISPDTLRIDFQIKNTGEYPLPFTAGWHPYFYSSDLYNSRLLFDSDKKLIFDETLITKGVETVELDGEFQIKDQQLDDCYILNKNEVLFTTPDYKLKINTSSKETFLQLYTPPNGNFIAVEPCTGPSNSFNNKMGLQTLEPGSEYKLFWTVEMLK